MVTKVIVFPPSVVVVYSALVVTVVRDSVDTELLVTGTSNDILELSIPTAVLEESESVFIVESDEALSAKTVVLIVLGKLVMELSFVLMVDEDEVSSQRVQEIVDV